LVELGLEPSLVGITKFDRYPPSIKQKPVVGGFLDVNTEAVIRNNPSILFSLVEGDESLRRIRSYGIRVELVDHRSLSGILDSITAIAKICGIVERGKKLVSRLNSDVARATAGVVPRKVPLNVLIVVGREVSADGVSSVYVSGRDGFYNDLLVVAGASNAYDGPTLSVPTLSSEGLKSLQPDVIIEMVGSDIQVPADDDIRESWKHLKLIPAVAQKAIFIMRNDYVTIPGPRYPLLLQDIIRVLSEVRK
jgi:iron complex transport system substrate-binding protein